MINDSVLVRSVRTRALSLFSTFRRKTSTRTPRARHTSYETPNDASACALYACAVSGRRSIRYGRARDGDLERCVLVASADTVSNTRL